MFCFITSFITYFTYTNISFWKCMKCKRHQENVFLRLALTTEKWGHGGGVGVKGPKSWNFHQKNDIFWKCRKLLKTSRKLVPQICPYNWKWGNGGLRGQNFEILKNIIFSENVGNCKRGQNFENLKKKSFFLNMLEIAQNIKKICSPNLPIQLKIGLFGPKG